MIFKTPILATKETEVVKTIDDIYKSLKYAVSTPSRWYGLLRRSAFARAIRGSNSIEGYNVSADDALAAAEGQEPEESAATDWQAVTGYRNAMTYVLQLADDPHFTYSEGFIRSLHFMMLQYDLSKNPGRWRPGSIFVRDEQKSILVYEGPAAEQVPRLVGELIESLNDSPGKPPNIVTAAMAHLNLVMIHPFSDGNGRMARCLQTLVLARMGILAPQFCSIEEYLGRNTQDYYEVLSKVGGGSWHPENDARPWVRFCLTAHFHQATTLLRRTKEINKLWNELEEELKKKGLPERMLFALVDAASGYRIRNSMYRSIAEISDYLAGRDLKQLVELGFLISHGAKRGRTYQASDILKKIRERTREPKSTQDPFGGDE